MKSIGHEHIRPSGDLAYRAWLNLQRFEREDYAMASMHDHTEGWPGDYEGRVLLALVLEARCLQVEPPRLNELLAALPCWLNAQGYFGPILPPGELDEQQLAGNSWFLRALCESYEWKHDTAMLERIGRLARSLYVPALGRYDVYPCRPEGRPSEGGVYGNLTGSSVEGWRLSSDTGCAFVALDGVSHAFALLKDPGLGSLAMEIARKFLSIDVVGLSFQTHATLSTLRGLLRLYEATGEPTLLEGAMRVFGVYCREAMTENYENYNWFGRPTWTEPCAVIDSFLLAEWLWRISKQPGFLELAHDIWFNGIAFEQRANGGFGCNSCAGAESPDIAPTRVFEASWCCTMRGAEGLAHAIGMSAYLEDDALILPFYNDGVLTVPFAEATAVLLLRTQYPEAGSVVLDVLAGSAGHHPLKFFVPSWVDVCSIALDVDGTPTAYEMCDGFLSAGISLEPGRRIALSFGIDLRKVRARNVHSIGDHVMFRHGTLILGAKDLADRIPYDTDDFHYLGNAQYGHGHSDMTLFPLRTHLHLSIPDQMRDRRSILFPDPAAHLN
jgi:uncharacterized protein